MRRPRPAAAGPFFLPHTHHQTTTETKQTNKPTNQIKSKQQDFYYARQGPAWDRRFTIVAGLTQEGVDACGMLDRGSEIWLNWNKGDDASLHQFRCV